MKDAHPKNSSSLFDAKAILGEGPVWDWKKQLLFWVDIEGKVLHQHNPYTHENRKWQFDEMPGTAVPKEDGNMLVAFESGLKTFDFETETLIKHNVLENRNPIMRFNDGKVGPCGQFFIGSMHKKFEAGTGNLYCVDKDFKTSIVVPNTTISNGMAWTSNNRTFYYIDSPTFTLFSFDYDMETGSITNRKSAIKVPQGYGSPDGMCIDSEDMLWVAHWGGNCVRRWNPKTATVLEKIDVEAPHVTSCCFGGKDLKTLYITAARSGLNKKQLEEFPLSGGLFGIELNVEGTPITYF